MSRPATVIAHALTLASVFTFFPLSLRAVRLVDSTGQPVSGAKVIISFGRDNDVSALPPAAASYTSDKDGKIPVELPVVRGGTISVDHASFAPLVIETRDDQIGPHEIRLDAGHTWRGRVVTANINGGSLSGDVCVQGQFKNVAARRIWQRCSRVEHGTFEVAGLPTGPIAFDLQMPGYLPRSGTVDPKATTTLRVVRGILLRGIVIDSRKSRVANAAINAGRSQTMSGDDGHFEIAVEALPIEVTTDKRGFRAAKTVINDERPFQVRLAPVSTIVGTLITADGEPVRDASADLVRILENGGHSRLWTNIDVDKRGDFVIEVPEAGDYTLALSASAFRATRFSDLHIGDEATFSLGLVSLTRGSGIRGTVVNGIDGKGMGGAWIEVTPAGAQLLQTVGEPTARASISDNDGKFTVAGYDAGRYLLTIRRGRFAPVHRLVDLDSGTVLDIGLIALDAGIEIRGTVVASEPAAAANVPIKLFDPAREVLVPFVTAVTDDRGAFTLSHVSPGHYRVEIGGSHLLSAQEIGVTSREPVVTLSLQAGGARIIGKIARRGLPVHEGTMNVVSELDPSRRRGKIIMQRQGQTLAWGLPQTTWTTAVGTDGSFVLHGAPTGLARFWYVGPDGETVFRSIVVSEEADQIVQLDLSGQALQGRVVDAATGQGLNATVRLFDRDGRSLTQSSSDAAGNFRFGDLESDTYMIDARADGYEPASMTEAVVKNESSPVVLTLQRGSPGAISAVFTRVDGTPVNGVPVTVFDARGTLMTSLPTNDAGRCDFQNIAPGKYIVGWSDALAGAGCSSFMQVDSAHTARVSCKLERGASVVLRCPSHQCAGARVGLLEIDSTNELEMSPMLTGITPGLRLDRDGEVSIGRLAAGRYRFKLWVAGRNWDQDVTVGSDDVVVTFD